ncbi:MAG: hypothetical protein J7517_09825 [Sphingobium yanoikuyae]|nr:hypothetical protein [Sphingobium yanoikuyae]
MAVVGSWGDPATLAPSSTASAIALLNALAAKENASDAAAAHAEADARLDALEVVDADDRLDALDALVKSPALGGQFLGGPIGGSAPGDPPAFRNPEVRDLMEMRTQERGRRYVAELLMDSGIPIDNAFLNDDMTDGYGAFRNLRGNDVRAPHITMPNPPYYFRGGMDIGLDRMVLSALATGGIYDTPTMIFEDPNDNMFDFDTANGARDFHFDGLTVMKYRSMPASALIYAILVRAPRITANGLIAILNCRNGWRFMAGCGGGYYPHLHIEASSIAIKADAGIGPIRIGLLTGTGTLDIDPSADIVIGADHRGLLSTVNNWTAKQNFNGGAQSAYVPYGVGGYSSLLVPTRQEIYEKIEATEADRLAQNADRQLRDSVNLTGNLPSSVTLTRASTARYFNASGVLTTAAVDVARMAYRYNGAAWVSAGLQIEAAATNLITYSSDFTNAYWNKSNVTVTLNSGPAIDGVTGMALLSATGNMVLRENSTITVVDATTYVWSGKFKAAPSPIPWLVLSFGNSGALTAGVRVWFNPATGTVGTSSLVGTGWVLVGTEVENLGNGVYRIGVAFTTSGTVLIAPRIEGANGNGSGATNVSGLGVYADNFQLELGSKMTSYIPTSGATASRSADVATVDLRTARYSPKGPVSVRYGFDDGTTQTATGVALTSGAFVIPTNLNRRKIKSVLNLTTEG